MGFDPFEEDLDLPAVLVQVGDGQRRQDKVVGEERELAMRFGIEKSHPAQLIGIRPMGAVDFEADGLIALHAGGGRGVRRLTPLVAQIVPGPDNKEGGLLMEPEKPLGVEVGPVHDVDGAGLHRDLVEKLHIVDPAGQDADDSGNATLEIQQRMHFDGGLGPFEVRPREERQAQFDCGGIEDVGGPVQLQGEGGVGVGVAGDPDELAPEVGEDPPVAGLVGIGQGAARHAAPDAQVIQPARQGIEREFDGPQTPAAGELGEGQAQELVPAGERAHPVSAGVAVDQSIEGFVRQEIHELREDGPASVHKPFLGSGMNSPGMVAGDSNRGQGIFRATYTYKLLFIDQREL